jgi:CBS domain-containing protein
MPTVREILARKGPATISIGPTATVLEAAQLMNERGIGALLVLKEGQLEGIFTERDLMRRVVAAQRSPATTTVAEVMTPNPITTREETRAEECAAIMTTRRIRHLPVVSPQGLAGMVTIGDLMAYQVADQAATIAHLNSYLYENR